jgi:CheY-like chemotaxis protein
MDGIEATRRLRARATVIQILGLSSQLWMEPIHPIEEAGAAGYFVKASTCRRLIEHMLGIHASLRSGSRPDGVAHLLGCGADPHDAIVSTRTGLVRNDSGGNHPLHPLREERLLSNTRPQQRARFIVAAVQHIGVAAR